MQKQVQVPMVQKVQRHVQVPVVQKVRKTVEVPQVEYVDQVMPVPVQKQGQHSVTFGSFWIRAIVVCYTILLSPWCCSSM